MLLRLGFLSVVLSIRAYIRVFTVVERPADLVLVRLLVTLQDRLASFQRRGRPGTRGVGRKKAPRRQEPPRRPPAHRLS